DIKLSKEYSEKQKALYELIDPEMIRTIYQPRKPFAHKGIYGYACLLAGSYGMMGAAILSARACLKSGVGKLNCYIPKIGYDIMKSSGPEAMCTTVCNKYLKKAKSFKIFDVLGIGPCIGQKPSHKKLLEKIFK